LHRRDPIAGTPQDDKSGEHPDSSRNQTCDPKARRQPRVGPTPRSTAEGSSERKGGLKAGNRGEPDHSSNCERARLSCLRAGRTHGRHLKVYLLPSPTRPRPSQLDAQRCHADLRHAGDKDTRIGTCALATAGTADVPELWRDRTCSPSFPARLPAGAHGPRTGAPVHSRGPAR
jgi:hypothetical protein